MIKESEVQKDILKLLKNRGAYVVKVIAANKSGIPDLLVCYKGYFIGLELKTERTKNEASKLQLLNIKKIQSSGGTASVVWSTLQVEEILNNLDINKEKENETL